MVCRYLSLNARTGTLICVQFEIFVAVKIHLKMKAAISSLISVPMTGDPKITRFIYFLNGLLGFILLHLIEPVRPSLVLEN